MKRPLNYVLFTGILVGAVTLGLYLFTMKPKEKKPLKKVSPKIEFLVESPDSSQTLENKVLPSSVNGSTNSTTFYTYAAHGSTDPQVRGQELVQFVNTAGKIIQGENIGVYTHDNNGDGLPDNITTFYKKGTQNKVELEKKSGRGDHSFNKSMEFYNQHMVGRE